MAPYIKRPIIFKRLLAKNMNILASLGVSDSTTPIPKFKLALFKPIQKQLFQEIADNIYSGGARPTYDICSRIPI